MSASAAILFAAAITWRLDVMRDRWISGSIALAVVWAALTVFLNRGRIWPEGALTAPGKDFYLAELRRRRAHLRSIWVWHGPLAVACVTLAAIGVRKAVPSLSRLLSVSPLLVALAVWTAMSVVRRLRQVAAIEQEIAETARPDSAKPA